MHSIEDLHRDRAAVAAFREALARLLETMAPRLVNGPALTWQPTPAMTGEALERRASVDRATLPAVEALRATGRRRKPDSAAAVADWSAILTDAPQVDARDLLAYCDRVIGRLDAWIAHPPRRSRLRRATSWWAALLASTLATAAAAAIARALGLGH